MFYRRVDPTGMNAKECSVLLIIPRICVRGPNILHQTTTVSPQSSALEMYSKYKKAWLNVQLYCSLFEDGALWPCHILHFANCKIHGLSINFTWIAIHDKAQPKKVALNLEIRELKFEVGRWFRTSSTVRTKRTKILKLYLSKTWMLFWSVWDELFCVVSTVSPSNSLSWHFGEEYSLIFFPCNFGDN